MQTEWRNQSVQLHDLPPSHAIAFGNRRQAFAPAHPVQPIFLLLVGAGIVVGAWLFAGRSLAPFKVPRTVLFLDEIPKGATGKMQRIGMAEKLGLVS